MNRRDFMKLVGAGSALAGIGASPGAFASMDALGRWNSYRLSCKVVLPSQPGPARLWAPIPLLGDSNFQRNQGTIWTGNADKVQFDPLSRDHQPVLYAEWRKSGERTLEVSTIVKTLDRRVDVTKPISGALPREAKEFLGASALVPLDKEIRGLAADITKGAKGPVEEAKAIYDWVIDKVAYDVGGNGVGRGDVRAMIKSGAFKGRMADAAALFVTLSRAAGVPARLAFGVMLDKSKLSPALGEYGDVSRGQQARAEFFAPGLGWVPVDPGGVLRAAAEGGMPIDDSRVTALRWKFFGTWEMNWVVYNQWESLPLKPLPSALETPFFVYPHAELASKPQDSLDPQAFTYAIASAELVGTGADFSDLTGPGVKNKR